MKDEYYASREARLDTVIGEASYFTMLTRLNDSFASDASYPRWPKFSAWCEKEHGFRPLLDAEGGITPKPEITDPQKYTVCLLKYGG